MEKKVELLPPNMPNFLFIKRPVGKKQDGINPMKIAVAELSEEEAEQYGEMMKKSFIKHWKRRKKEAAK